MHMLVYFLTYTYMQSCCSYPSLPPPSSSSWQVWDVKSLKNVADLTGHVGIVYALQVMESPGSTRLFSACYDKTLRVSIYHNTIIIISTLPTHTLYICTY